MSQFNEYFPASRLRRMRQSDFSRRLMAENRLTVDDLIYPMFIVEGENQRQVIASMPGIEPVSYTHLTLPTIYSV